MMTTYEVRIFLWNVFKKSQGKFYFKKTEANSNHVKILIIYQKLTKVLGLKKLIRILFDIV